MNDDNPGLFTTLGAIMLALFVFLVMSVLLSLIVTVPLKLLRGCTFKQAFELEPHGVSFGITALLLLMIYMQVHSHYGPDPDSMTALSSLAMLSAIKSVHSIFVIWANPTLGTVKTKYLVRH